MHGNEKKKKKKTSLKWLEDEEVKKESWKMLKSFTSNFP